MMRELLVRLVVGGMVLVAASAASALEVETVTIGNPGNAGEWSGESYGYGGYGPDAVCGAVSYTYNIGKYEVTAGQYCEFLNAVAATDPYWLYDTAMGDPAGEGGCNIQRTGSSGSYSYTVASDWADRPVNWVTWGDAARFANWLHNGQPTGAQGPATTEDGAYCLNGAVMSAALAGITREPDWRWAIPSEDEWYKAAYHKNNGVTGDYFKYPTSSDSTPSNDLLTPDGGNNVNFEDGDYTIGSPYYRTQVGEFELSESPYGTFDQAGNVWEWHDTMVSGNYGGMRGGSYCHRAVDLLAVHRVYTYRGDEDKYIGFRVAEVPEPATVVLLAIGGLALIRRRR